MTKVKQLDGDQQRIWRVWLRAARRTQGYLDMDLRLTGLGLAKYEILVTLSEAPGQQLRTDELAHAVSQSHSRLTHTVKRLETRGHTEHTSYADDGRGVLASLTTEGMSFLTQVVLGHMAAVRQILTDVIKPGDLKALGRACDAILAVPDYDEHPRTQSSYFVTDSATWHTCWTIQPSPAASTPPMPLSTRYPPWWLPAPRTVTN